MSLAEFRSLVDQVPLLQRVVLHGVGEPLLNKHLADMVDYLKARQDPPYVLFNSNAILLSDSCQARLIEAGLDEFRVSTDAAHRELYARIRGVDAFDRVKANVKAFARRVSIAGRGPKLSLWFTALQDNLSDLPDLVRLAHELGVGEVYVQRLVHYGQGLALEDQSVHRSLRAAEDVQLARAEEIAGEHGLLFRASGATTPRESLLAGGSDTSPWSACRRPSTLMYITVNGNVLPCCFSPFTTSDYQGLILGNAYQTSLIDIWNGDCYRRFRAALQTETPWESCDRCGVLWSL
jgi:MoaA/NifB/PqqE/SkfB family radical SAM enzyme